MFLTPIQEDESMMDEHTSKGSGSAPGPFFVLSLEYEADNELPAHAWERIPLAQIEESRLSEARELAADAAREALKAAGFYLLR